MKKQISIIPVIIFLIILSIFFYLLMIERNPSEIPSNLLDKKVPQFETKSLLKDEKAKKKCGTIRAGVSSYRLSRVYIIMLALRDFEGYAQ